MSQVMRSPIGLGGLAAAVPFAAASLALAVPADAALPAPGALPVVSARADVSVSTGERFAAEMRFAALDDASYVRRTPQGTVTVTIDAAGVWSEGSDGRRRQPEDLAFYVLSHQFHAQLLAFDALNEGATVRQADDPACDCEDRIGNRGAAALGVERMVLRTDRRTGRAQELRVVRDGQPPVRVTFSDWRRVATNELPFALAVDDGQDVFAFTFDRIEVIGPRG